MTAAKKPTRKARRPVEPRPAERPLAEPRRRRTAEVARAAILDAAERRLVTSGPAGIRLQEVAADVGVSHPTVLHHFGSREELVREVCERRYAHIRADVVAAMLGATGGPALVGHMLDSVSGVLHTTGHARVVMWLALEGVLQKGEDGPRLVDVGRAAHELRLRQRHESPAPLEDTLHVVALSTLVLVAEAVLGPIILGDLGLGTTAAAGARFRSWLAQLLADHLAHGPREPGPM